MGKKTEAILAGALLCLILLVYALNLLAGDRPLPIDKAGRWQTASKGVILHRCPHCGNLTLIQVPKGTEFKIREVAPLQEEPRHDSRPRPQSDLPR